MNKQPIKTQPAQEVLKREPYKIGDGDSISAVRPGAQDALRIPSRIGDLLHYRVGRKEAV